MGPRLEWWLWHVGLAVLTTLVVFATSVLASWFHLREPGKGSIEQRFTLGQLRALDRVVREFHRQHGRWPESLCEMDESWCTNDGSVRDDWQNPVVYTSDTRGFQLYSLGRDNRPGGIGLDADLYSDDRNIEAASLTFGQFLDDTLTRGNRVFCMLLAIAAGVQYLALQSYDRPTAAEGHRKSLVAALGVFVAATAIAFLVTPLHIPSGH